MKSNYKKLWILFLIIAFSCSASIAQEKANVVLDSLTQKHSPKKALMYSAILPGMGQVYNKKWWKVPIVYAGLGGLGYMIVSNNQNYQKFKNDYAAAIDPDLVYEGPYSTEVLKSYKDAYRRNRDLMIIYTFGWYGLNLLDAYVDGHMFYYDVSDDLSFRLKPCITTPCYSIGLGLEIKF